ncbi:hypothetical protein QYF36_025571 [Acer negundo]|nr:hypothetical protein QYF36_025571 [Acer negundo]
MSNMFVVHENPLIWSGVVPPKVDLFLWMLAKKRLMVRDLLPKFIGDLIGTLICPFCKTLEESIDHLFIGCKWYWRLWSACLSWWEISACLPDNLSDWMDCWKDLCPIASSSKVWAMEMVIWRVVWWFKTYGKGYQLPVSLLMMNLKVGCVDIPKTVRKVNYPWIPHVDGVLKFNVDGQDLLALEAFCETRMVIPYVGFLHS